MGKPGQFVLAPKGDNVLRKTKKKEKSKNQAKAVIRNVKKAVQNGKSKKNRKQVIETKPTNNKSKSKTKQNIESTESFQDKLANSLKSSRFRFLNELLYTNESDQATSIVTQDPEAFKTYHEGYRQQVTQWPINPLDRIIKSVKSL